MTEGVERQDDENRGPERALESYSSWRQVAGYFDGDGNVGVEIVRRVLHLRIRFVDTWLPQIQAIKAFLNKNGIATGKIGRDNKGVWQSAYRLEIAEIASVIRASKAMRRFCVKKSNDLRITIDYLEGRTTGNQALATFNAEVRSGRRRGIVRRGDLPYTRPDGLRVAQLENARKARAAYEVNVSADVQKQIRSDHHESKLSYIRLSKKYGFSTSVIRRILSAP